MPLGVARLDLGQVQHLVDQARQPLGLGHDDGDKVLALLWRHVFIVAHQLGQCANRRERRAQLVRDRRHKVVLEPVQALELLVGAAQFGRGQLQRMRLFLQLVRVGANLRGFVQNAQHILGREHFFFGHRRHQHPGRSAAYCAGQLGFNKLHQPGVGPDGVHAAHASVARIGIEQGSGLGRAHEALAQAQQVGHIGLAAPEHRAGACRALENIDEQQGLAGLTRRRRAPQRQADIGGDIHQQAPEQRVRQPVQSAQAQQLLGPQQCHAPRAEG